VFDACIARWQLTLDGTPVVTSTSRLLPVLYNGSPAMLKIALEAEERHGAALMRWWGGKGAARVLAHEGEALLLERALGTTSLAALARQGNDDEACRILCRTAARLHRPANRPLPPLVPLTHWFRELAPAAAGHGGLFSLCSATAQMLLARPQDAGVLHGDIHHGNVLHFGARGWLAIDPKSLLQNLYFVLRAKMLAWQNRWFLMNSGRPSSRSCHLPPTRSSVAGLVCLTVLPSRASCLCLKVASPGPCCRPK